MQMNMLKEVFLYTATTASSSTYRSSTYATHTHTHIVYKSSLYIYEFLHEFYIVCACVCVCAFWGHKMLWWLHKILKNLISKFSCFFAQLPRPLTSTLPALVICISFLKAPNAKIAGWMSALSSHATLPHSLSLSVSLACSQFPSLSHF